jgi:hypothetical protein
LSRIPSLTGPAENDWYDLLFGYCRQVFSDHFLPSHDHLHHDRVWKNARSILLLLDSRGISAGSFLPGQLLLACFFHDTGLTVTDGEKHGRESRRICHEFIRKHKHRFTGYPEKALDEVLHAIEFHDDKSRKTDTHGAEPALLPLLSAADDMDAFGLMGIYRYAEIYLLRGIPSERLPVLVSANVKTRYENLRQAFAYLEDFIAEQEKRYRQVYDFYLRLAQAYASRHEKPGWEPVLIDYFGSSLAAQRNILKPGRLLPSGDFDREIREWFRALEAENPAMDRT